MATRPKLRVYYWKQNQFVGNLGDALVPILLGGLGYDAVPRSATNALVHNREHCLIVVGSLLTEYDLAGIGLPINVWGCGWKGLCPPSAMLAQLRIHAVRGPHTVAGLGLPANTPLGDPALLLPYLAPRPVQSHGHTVVVPHIHRTKLMPSKLRCRLTVCDECVLTQVIQPHAIRNPGGLWQALSLGKSWLRLGMRPYTIWGAIDRIAGADFVLTGSLHGAILAQAYGVPWAAYDDGYVNAPAKWLDWAAYLGVDLEFVTTLAAGQQWWQTKGERGVVRDLGPLLDAFPYPIPTTIASRTEQVYAGNY